MSDGTVISRLVRAWNAFNAINARTVTLYLQKSPGAPGASRGIDGLDYHVWYEVLANRVEVQSGRTGSNGQIEVRVTPGGTTILGIDGSEYEIHLSVAALQAETTTTGRKERLRLLGYQIGHSGADLDGVDNSPDVFEYERSVLDFQAEHGLTLNADETTIDNTLKTAAGG